MKLRAPVDGLSGYLWRTITTPVRAVAPVALLSTRALTGEYWMESVTTCPGPGPDVTVAEDETVQGPEDGAGPLNHRRYSVTIRDAKRTAAQLVDDFRRDPNRFSPTSFATFVPDPAPDGLTPEAEVTVKLPGPWNGPVLVQAVEHQLIRFETRCDHMEAGWIEFSASATKLDLDGEGDGDGGSITFLIESFARSGDLVFDALYHEVGIGKLVQTQMWVRTLESIVAASGGHQVGRVSVNTTIYLGAVTR